MIFSGIICEEAGQNSFVRHGFSQYQRSPAYRRTLRTKEEKALYISLKQKKIQICLLTHIFKSVSLLFVSYTFFNAITIVGRKLPFKCYKFISFSNTAILLLLAHTNTPALTAI
jgi:hypothetical protein